MFNFFNVLISPGPNYKKILINSTMENLKHIYFIYFITRLIESQVISVLITSILMSNCNYNSIFLYVNIELRLKLYLLLTSI